MQARRHYTMLYLGFQLLGFVLLTLLVWRMYAHFTANMQRFDMGFSLHFLRFESGFPIMQKWLSHDSRDSHLNVLCVGLLNTLIVSGLGMFFSTILGALIALAGRSQQLVFRALSVCLISIFRNVPLLIQILFWYNLWIVKMPAVHDSWSWGVVLANKRGIYMPLYQGDVLWLYVLLVCLLLQWALLRYRQYVRFEHTWVRLHSIGARLCLLWMCTSLLFLWVAYAFGGVQLPTMGRFNVQGWHVYPEFIGLLLGLSFYTSAYHAESMRGAIAAVPEGQYEACDVLHLSRWTAFTRVVLPQSLPGMLPPMSSHYMNLTKNTSLGLAVGYPEMFALFAGTVLNHTGRAVEIIAIIMVVYLGLSMLIALMMNLLNKRQSVWTGTQQG